MYLCTVIRRKCTIKLRTFYAWNRRIIWAVTDGIILGNEVGVREYFRMNRKAIGRHNADKTELMSVNKARNMFRTWANNRCEKTVWFNRKKGGMEKAPCAAGHNMESRKVKSLT